MKPQTKKIILAVALLGVGLSILASEKIDKLKAIFSQMTIKPYKLPQNIKFGNPNSLGIPQTVSFTIDIIIQNPTADDFAVTGYVATLTDINVYYKGMYVGTAKVQLSEISTPAHNSLVLHNIPIELNTIDFLTNVTDFTKININDLDFTAKVDVLGISYEIGN